MIPIRGNANWGGGERISRNFRATRCPAIAAQHGTPFYGYVYTNVSELFGECANASHTHDGNCNGTVFSANYGTFMKQRINQMGWQTFYDPIALVPYMLRVDGKKGFITYDDATSTYLRCGMPIGNGTWAALSCVVGC